MALAITPDEVAALLHDAPFARLYGYRLHSLADGECVLDIPYQPQFDRPDGLISGPVYMAAADVGVWIAAMTRLGRAEGTPTVTIEMKSAFLRGATREDIQCRATILKWGKRILYGA
ncbi:MAG: PaaI family thioesterase, partial [Chloroflexi bacterium]|nr:PaaI family thioesterase [Chloroflexota bacterium]